MSHRDNCMSKRDAERLGEERGRRHYNAGMEGYSRPPEEIEGCREAEEAYQNAYRSEQRRQEERRREEEEERRYYESQREAHPHE